MTRWEYYHCTVMHRQNRYWVNGQELGQPYHEWLNTLGRDGWELVSTQDGGVAVLLYFKRPLPT